MSDSTKLIIQAAQALRAIRGTRSCFCYTLVRDVLLDGHADYCKLATRALTAIEKKTK